MRLVVMVGPPGCGKSTTSELFRRSGWIIVSQDELGSRQHCETAVFHALASQQRVVVDRTNIDQAQRSHWVGIARKVGAAFPIRVPIHTEPTTHTPFLIYIILTPPASNHLFGSLRWAAAIGRG